MPKYTLKDFKSDQEIRWCPGCGDYSVLAALQRTLPLVCGEKGIDKDKIVVVSGIGCSSRLPYYVDTYGSQHPRPRHRDRDRNEGRQS